MDSSKHLTIDTTGNYKNQIDAAWLNIAEMILQSGVDIGLCIDAFNEYLEKCFD